MTAIDWKTGRTTGRDLGALLAGVGAFRLMVLTVAAVDLLGLALAGATLRHGLGVVLACLGLLLVERFYLRVRPRPALAALAGSAVNLVSFVFVAGILSYVAASFGAPLVDDSLDAADRWLGLDWLAYYNWVVSQSALTRLGMRLAYNSLMLQIVVLLVVFHGIGRHERARELVWGFAVIALTVVVVSGLVPAVGEFVTHHVEQQTPYIPQFRGVYEGSLRVLDSYEMAGIVTFPSFHSALAVLLVWAARGLGRLVFPVAALNAVVLAVTPIYGGHYFVDVAAGIAITLCWLPALRGISETRPALH